jgi:curved DNA-binding protein
VTVPPGTHGGAKLRLRGKGVPGAPRGDAGDLFVTLRIRVPRDLDDDDRRAVEALARHDPRDLREELFR